MDLNRWLIDLSERAAPRFFGTPFDELTVPERVFVAVWALEADVNNGGFDQYYLNSAGDHAWFAPAALRTIGAERTAAIVEQANAEFGPDGPPRLERCGAADVPRPAPAASTGSRGLARSGSADDHGPMRLAIAVLGCALVVTAGAPVAAAHGPCDPHCLSRFEGRPGQRIEVRVKSVRAVFNPRRAQLPYGPRALWRGRRAGVPAKRLYRSGRARRHGFRVPDVPGGRYPLAIWDGSEGGAHYTWTWFVVRRPRG